MKEAKIPEITVHGRFQPPLHVNHFHTYLANAFLIADKVHILITNPDLDETNSKEAPHRNKPENNPFTYEERVEIFENFFQKMGIPKSRYDFKPFNITNELDWVKRLDKKVPNLINVYGPWSKAKLEKFRNQGYLVAHSSIPKIRDISGTRIRQIIKSDMTESEKKSQLVKEGYMMESIDGLFKILKNKSITPSETDYH